MSFTYTYYREQGQNVSIYNFLIDRNTTQMFPKHTKFCFIWRAIYFPKRILQKKENATKTKRYYAPQLYIKASFY